MPPASSEQVRARMRAQRTRDTAPELVLRRALHADGLRYRVAPALLVPNPATEGALVRVRPDVLFPMARLAVFVDGCWWHYCPTHARTAGANREWWAAKLQGNARRDEAQTAALALAGWTVLRVWEHDLAGGVPDGLLGFVRRMVGFGRETRGGARVGALLRPAAGGVTCEAVWRVA